MALRLIFMGTPAFSVPTLEAIIEAGHGVVAVYSQPTRRAGRGMAELPGPVHAAALAHGLTVATPTSLKDGAELAAFTALHADAAVVVAYGLLLPSAILAATRLGCYNLHASALPRWRGAAPIQRAIMAGDTATACIVMRMEAGLDTGPMCLSEVVQIAPDMTAGALHDVLAPIGAALMVEALANLEAGELTQTPQPANGVTYAAKIDKAETRLDFTHAPNNVRNRVRGLAPTPGAWLEIGPPDRRERLRVLACEIVPGSGEPGCVIGPLTIACGVGAAAGAIRLTQVQRAGKRPQSAEEFARGFALTIGVRV